MKLIPNSHTACQASNHTHTHPHRRKRTNNRRTTRLNRSVSSFFSLLLFSIRIFASALTHIRTHTSTSTDCLLLYYIYILHIMYVCTYAKIQRIVPYRLKWFFILLPVQYKPRVSFRHKVFSRKTRALCSYPYGTLRVTMTPAAADQRQPSAKDFPEKKIIKKKNTSTVV